MVELVAKGRKRGRVMGETAREGKGLSGAQAWAVQPTALPLPPPAERAVHRCHQLPVPALRLSGHHGTQALPPAGATRGRPHQPHSAATGQGETAGGVPSWVLNRVLARTALCSQLAPGSLWDWATDTLTWPCTVHKAFPRLPGLMGKEAGL